MTNTLDGPPDCFVKVNKSSGSGGRTEFHDANVSLIRLWIDENGRIERTFGNAVELAGGQDRPSVKIGVGTAWLDLGHASTLGCIIEHRGP